MTNPLPSWNDGPAKSAILDFVRRVTTEGKAEFVAPVDRLALFDNDGTLWVEQPMYTQLAFILDDVKQLAPQHPEWSTTEPFKSVLENNLAGVAATGMKGVGELLAATQSGSTTADFAEKVAEWIESARHPRFDRAYTDCVYQPMLELMAFLRANGFTVYIVTGGGAEFVRPWSERIYGVPAQHVVGSTLKTTFAFEGGVPTLVRTGELDLLDDGPNKPVGINRYIGRQPLAAFGNSDGDLQMLQWTSGGEGPRLMAILHHTDGAREYAYDAKSPFGKLDKALTEANERGWVVIDMKRDWNVVFPP